MPVRIATLEDETAVAALHAVPPAEQNLDEFIRRSIGARSCYVFEEQGRLLGYGVLEYSFYGNGFISMLYVTQEARRRRVGRALMQYMEATCATPKLFTSTNLSNLPMQSLLTSLEWQLSGVIHNIDPGDPELVYFKPVSQAEG